MKKLITKALCTICFLGMAISLVINLVFQIIYETKDYERVASEYFYQIENILADNDIKLEQVKASFSKNCIIRARAAAYVAQQNPEMIEDRENCELIASLLQVDELHFFDANGMIYAGTHPEYYGLKMDDGSQINFFSPMLEDKSLELCQDVTPNTAEEKLMQYAAVWCQDGEKIVQVGLKPERILEAMEGNNISDLFAMISCEPQTTFFAVDEQTNEILGSTKKEYTGMDASAIGLDVKNATEKIDSVYQRVDGELEYCAMKKADTLILVQSCPPRELFAGLLSSVLIMLGYILLLFLLSLGVCYFFLDRTIIQSIQNINRQMKKIEQGDYSVALTENSTREFAELCHSINAMTASLFGFAEKVSKALELSEVPIGICEFNTEKRTLMTTSRVKDIMLFTDEEYQEYVENPEPVEMLQEKLFVRDKKLPKNVFRLAKDVSHYVRIEIFNYGKSRMVVLIDETANIVEKDEISKDRDTDLLTGLYNRRAFYRVMDNIFENPEERKDCVLILFDLDHLKWVNDEYGHIDGDHYILAFADLLHSCNAEYKVTSRMGGDEFTLFLYGYDDREEMQKEIAELASYRNERKVVLENGEEIPLEYSFGWSFGQGEESDYHKMLKIADERMYEDKKNRKKSI